MSARSMNMGIGLDGFPPWVPLVLLSLSLGLDLWEFWHTARKATAEPITAEDCYRFCAWSGSTPKTWASYSCECHAPRAELEQLGKLPAVEVPRRFSYFPGELHAHGPFGHAP